MSEYIVGTKHQKHIFALQILELWLSTFKIEHVHATWVDKIKIQSDDGIYSDQVALIVRYLDSHCSIMIPSFLLTEILRMELDASFEWLEYDLWRNRAITKVRSTTLQVWGPRPRPAILQPAQASQTSQRGNKRGKLLLAIWWFAALHQSACSINAWQRRWFRCRAGIDGFGFQVSSLICPDWDHTTSCTSSQHLWCC